MGLKLILDKVLIKPLGKEKQSNAGIFLPETQKEKIWGGDVLSVGSGLNDKSMRVKTGDIAFFGKYNHKSFLIDRQEYWVVEEGSIIALIREKEILAMRDMVIVIIHYEKKIGSIYVPDFKGTKKYQAGFHGEVIATGPDYLYDVKKGDKICFRRHEGNPFRYNEVDYVALKERWVEGVEK